MIPDRRNLPRRRVHSLVYVGLQPNNGGILLDLGEAGMRVSVAWPLTASRIVQFTFALDPRSRIHGAGRVAWLSESGKIAGVHFLDLPETSLHRIRQWLRESGPRPSADSPAPPIHHPSAPPPPPPTPAARPAPDPDDGVQLWIPPGPIVKYSPEPLSCPAPRNAPASAPVTTAVVEQAPVPSPPADTVAPADSPLPGPAAESLPSLAYCLYGIGEITDSPHDSPAHAPALAAATPLLPPQPSLTAVPLPRDRPLAPQPPPVSRDEEPVYVQPGLPPPSIGPNDRLPVFILPGCSGSPVSSPVLATSVFCDKLREIGWGLERDWHVRLGLLLEAAGFLVLWESPSLTLLAISLWTAGTLLLLDRKRPPAGWKRERRA